MRTSRSRWGISVLVLLTLVGCSHRAVEVAKVVSNPSAYNGRVVNVSGCFKADNEISVLLPCGELTKDTFRQAVWVENLEAFEHFESIDPTGQPRRASHEGTLTKTDQDRMERLFSSRNRSPFRVTLEGEFQAGQKYGHLGGFDKRLILYKVLAAEW